MLTGQGVLELRLSMISIAICSGWLAELLSVLLVPVSKFRPKLSNLRLQAQVLVTGHAGLALRGPKLGTSEGQLGVRRREFLDERGVPALQS